MSRSKIVSALIAGNRRFIANTRRREPNFFREHARSQAPRLLWIGCSDSRVPEAVVTDCGPGEIFVHRNIANIIAYNDVNIAAVVEYAVQSLKVPDIVVCGHYGCGGIRALVEDDIGDDYLANWLHIASRAVERARETRPPKQGRRAHDAFLRRVVEENVHLQISHLMNFALLRRKHRVGDTPRVHGCVYDLRNGKLHFLD
jgi:carbonic anhydrase